MERENSNTSHLGAQIGFFNWGGDQAVSKLFKLNSLFCVIWALTSAQVVILCNLG